jgi:hypothetical protein
LQDQCHHSARRLQQSPIFQVGAECLLVQEVYGVRPPYGVVVLAGGSQGRAAFTEEPAGVQTLSPPQCFWVGLYFKRPDA